MTEANVKCWGVIPAAGVGTRMARELPKQYLQVAGSTLLEHSLQALLACASIETVVVALHSEDDLASELDLLSSERVLCTAGGAQRKDSVLAALNALSQLAASHDWVLVHDAARPGVATQDIQQLIDQVKLRGMGGILAQRINDTVKLADTAGQVLKTLDRSHLWRAQTPQMFRYGQLREALLQAHERELEVTDEASAMELAGHPVQLVEGAANNLKVTVPSDLALAEFYLHTEKHRADSMRIGHGYDVHRFGPGNYVVLGGVNIPFERALEAHSDGDVLIHALCDALLGAAGLGDIGAHFPDTDPANANIDSRLLLRQVVKRLAAAGWQVTNLDTTVVAQEPKLSSHIAAMQVNLAADCNVTAEQVNVKATTTEKLGFAGRGEGIAAHAVVLLSSTSP